MKTRLWMRAYTRPTEGRCSVSPRNISPADLTGLSVLTLDSHRGTIDQEEDTLEQALAEMLKTLEGGYGPFMPEASFVLERDGSLLSASLVTLWEGRPLLAFAMTRPEEQGKGYARALIEKSMDALFRAGEERLFLAVTEGNAPAQGLYAKLGFEVLGPA